LPFIRNFTESVLGSQPIYMIFFPKVDSCAEILSGGRIAYAAFAVDGYLPYAAPNLLF
jgi:hypothetical protein